MDSLKEIFDAMNSRIRSPIFGSIAIVFIILNWKSLFFLTFSDTAVVDKFTYFDEHVSLWSGIILPIVGGLIFAIAAPWITLFSSWIADTPTTKRKIRQTKSVDKILSEKMRLEKTRSQLLANEEEALIDAAIREKQAREIGNEEISSKLLKQMEEIRDASRADTAAQLKMHEKMEAHNAELKARLAAYQKQLQNLSSINEIIADTNKEFNSLPPDGPKDEFLAIHMRLESLQSQQQELLRHLVDDSKQGL